MNEPWHPTPLPPLTRTQRRIKRAIEAGGIVIWCTSAEDPNDYDPDAHYLLLHADHSDPIGISYTEQVQQRSLLPLRWRGLLDENWLTPTSSTTDARDAGRASETPALEDSIASAFAEVSEEVSAMGPLDGPYAELATSGITSLDTTCTNREPSGPNPDGSLVLRRHTNDNDLWSEAGRGHD